MNMLSNDEKSMAEALQISRESNSQNPSKMRASSLESHFNACVALNIPPEPWELYEYARIFDLPRTDFFEQNRSEIIAEIARQNFANLLQHQARLSKEFTKALKHGNEELYLWSDARDIFPVLFEVGANARLEKLTSQLLKVQEKLLKKRSKRTRLLLESQAKDLEEELSNLSHAVTVQEINGSRVQVYKIEIEENFPLTIFRILRRAENKLRTRLTLQNLSEEWISETELYFRIKRLLYPEVIIKNGQPAWCNSRQSLDVWIPGRLIAIEYHGHDQLKRYPSPDSPRVEKIRSLCISNGVKQIQIRHDFRFSDEELRILLASDSNF